MHRRCRRAARQGGFTLLEVVTALVIIASAMIPLLTALGNSTEMVMDTVKQRRMRHLMQIIMADVRLGKISPSEENERYEEGTRGNFEGFGSEHDPDEYAHFEYSIDVLREEMIVGGGLGDEDDALSKAGFQSDSSGRLIGRPVSNDFDPYEDGGVPSGQMKRLVVVTIRSLGEDADSDLEYSLMTYLPVPGEEDRQIGGEGGEGGPGGGGLPGQSEGSNIDTRGNRGGQGTDKR